MNSFLSAFCLSLLLLGCASEIPRQDLERQAGILRQKRLKCSLSEPKTYSDLVETITELRAQRDAWPLARDDVLMKAADRRVRELSATNALGHQDKMGSGPLERLKKMGIHRNEVGENIGRVSHTEDPVFQILSNWVQGTQEFRNLVAPKYMRMGVAMAASEEYCYCIVIFSE